MELRVLSEVRNLLSRNVLNEHNLACVVCAVGCVHVLHQDKLDGICCYGVCVPVVLVLLHQDVGAWHPLFDLHGTVADVGGRVDRPGLAVCLDSSLVYRAESCKRANLVKVYARVGKLYYEGLIVWSGYC